MRVFLALRLPFAAAFLVVPVLAAAQTKGTAATRPHSEAPSARIASGPRALPIADYARWRTIQSPAIGADGRWVAWVYTQVRRDDQLHVKLADGDREYSVDGGSRPVFSDDARWVAYYVAPLLAGSEFRGGAGRSGSPGAGRAFDFASAPRRRVELLNLASGERVSWEDAATFEFSNGSAFFAVRRSRSQAQGRQDGADLILRDLAAGTDRLVGSVTDFAFNKPGSLLAYTVDAADHVGNGLYVTDLRAGNDRVIENARERYARLSWSDDGTALAALHGIDTDTLTQRANTIVAVTGLAPGSATHSRVVVAPATHGLPAGLVVSEKGALTWSDRNDRLFVGIKSQEPPVKPATRDDVVAPSDVDIFHVNDDRIQTVQRSQAFVERNRTDRAVLDVASAKVTRLSDSTFRTVLVTRNGRWAVLGDDRSYVSDYQPAKADYYRLDIATGDRTPIVAALGRSLGLSPDSRYFLYWKDNHVWSYDLAANRHVNITSTAPVSFVNTADDHVGEKPPYGVSGYSRDGKFVVLEHRFDLWLVALDGSVAPRALTAGIGEKTQTRLRYVAFDSVQRPTAFGPGRGGRGAAPEVTIDLAKPILLSAYGEWTKKSGYYLLAAGRTRELVYADANYGRPQKAAAADRYLFSREDWAEFPDLRVSDTNASFVNAKRITDANPQQSEYRWGRRILFDFADKDGHKLQGTLAIPDSYQAGERLPMLVNFYEKNSQNLHVYQTPRYATAPQFAGYVSNGYLVMQPDIYFHTRTSHSDMLQSVENAVKKVIEMGYADPARIGLQGHSYSGGGAAYIAGHSTMFAAVVAGAAPIDLTTEFNTIFRGSGQSNQAYDITGQGRYGTDPYTDPDLYYQQSPISGVTTMNTALLQMQGDNDQTVEYLQGLEFYNALRFNKKNVIFLSYPGEDHNLRKLENQIDYETRIGEFFDHYLKGAPAPAWMTRGERYVDKDKRKPLPITVERGAKP